MKTRQIFLLAALISLSLGSATGERVEQSIEHRYSSVIVSESGSTNVFLRVSNPGPDRKELITTLSGVNAVFSSNQQKTISYDLQNGEERRFIINIRPESTADDQIIVNTENQLSGVNTTSEVPVTVREVAAVSRTREVPGIRLFQVLFTVLVSSCLYYLRP